MNLGSTIVSAMARASNGSRNLLEAMNIGSPLPRVSSNGDTPRAISGTNSSDAWAGAWTKFLDSNPDALPGALPGGTSWGSFSSLSDLDKVVGLPPASASAQALAPSDSVSEMRAGEIKMEVAPPPPSPVPPQPTRAIVTTVGRTSAGAPRTSVGAPRTSAGAPRTSAGPPQQAGSRSPGRAAATVAAARATTTAVAATMAHEMPPPGGDAAAEQPASKKRMAAPPPPAAAGDGLSKEELKHRKKRTKIVTPTYIPEAVTVAVPNGGFAAGATVEAALETGQVVKLVISPQQAAVSAAAPQMEFNLETSAMADSLSAQYKVDLRGGRVQWVSRKKLETILRNRRSAAACRNTVVDLRLEVDELQVQLTSKDEQIASLQHMLEKANAGAKTVAPLPRGAPPASFSGNNLHRLGLQALPPQLGRSNSRSPRSIAAQAKNRLVRTLSGGARRSAAWY